MRKGSEFKREKREGLVISKTKANLVPKIPTHSSLKTFRHRRGNNGSQQRVPGLIWWKGWQSEEAVVNSYVTEMDN